MRDNILVVRPTELLSDGVTIGPAVPGAWVDSQVEDSGWMTFWPRGRAFKPQTFVHVLTVAEGLAGGRRAYLFQGPSPIMDNIFGNSFFAWSGCFAMRADAAALAISVRANWYDQANIGFVTNRMAGYRDTAGEVRAGELEPP